MKNRITLALSMMVISCIASGCSPRQSFGLTITSTATPTENNATVPTLVGWDYFGDHFYKLTNPMSWSDAETQAMNWGGHLVTINDRTEESWLRSQYGNQEYIWIGFSDIKTEGSWVWAGGGPITYTNWCEGEPNNRSGDNRAENAAILNWGVGGTYGDCWNDIPPDGQNRGIVEKLP